MWLPRSSPSLDVVRAGLGCLLVFLQARAASYASAQQVERRPFFIGPASLVARDWGFAAAVACHVCWILSSTLRVRCTRYLCCASRVAPKLGLVAQVLAERFVPATATWLNEACWQRWYWRAMAEAFVYTCDEFPVHLMVPAAAFDVLCTAAVWSAVYTLTDEPPHRAAAAYVLLRLSISAFVNHFQQSANLGWLQKLARAWFPRSQTTKAEVSYNLLSSQTPVHSSMVCCNNPTILSRITADSEKDLEPVRLERLSGEPALSLQPAAPVVGGMEAYELARRLVSSSGSGNPGSNAVGSSNSSYTSAARKVRVSVKIPDRSPEDLPAGCDSKLRINGRREAALVLFTYIRRGCVQLIMDVFFSVPAGGAGVADRGGVAASCSNGNPGQGTGAGGSDLAGVGRHMGCGVEGTQLVEGGEPGSSRCSGVEGAGAVVQERLLRAINDEGLLAGRTLTVQVGPNVSQVHMSAADTALIGSGLGALEQELQRMRAEAGPPPALPPDVSVWPQVVCTSGSYDCLAGACGVAARLRKCQQPKQAREVVVACSWHADPAVEAAAGSGTKGAGLQITARQQGSFLPVALLGHHVHRGGGLRTCREQLAEGAVTAAVGCQQGQGSPAPVHEQQRGTGGETQGLGACHLAFMPTRREGLVQVELCREGVHSAMAANVLLLPNRAAANELQQVRAAAASKQGPNNAVVQNVLRDFGTFLDVSFSLAHCHGASTAATPGACVPSMMQAGTVIAWTMAQPCIPGSVPVPCHIILNESGLDRFPTDADAATMSTSTAAPEDAAAELWAMQQRREHVRGLATIGSRMGFNLLQYFLSSGLGSCAVHVLDVLQERFGMPASLVAGYVCPEGMTLLHHAARSSTFGAVAALAWWLEERGVALDWNASCPSGLTPLHLVAVAPESSSASALVQVRWPAAHAAWRGRGAPQQGCFTSPAEFAAMARSPSAMVGRQRAVDAAVMLGIGTIWRVAAGLWRRVVPQGLLQVGRDYVTPSLAFALPSLEASYESWLARRTILADHLLVALYAAYSVTQVCKQGRSFLATHAVGVLLLGLRLLLLAAASLCSGYAAGLHRWLLPGRGAVPGGRKEGPETEEASDDVGARPVRAALRWCVVTREGRAIVTEAVRTLLMLAMAAGLLQLPHTWRRLVQLRLDVVYNVAMRPMAVQLRTEAYIASTAIALVGETAVMALAAWEPADWSSAALYTVLAFGQGLITHTLGLGLAVMLQAAARRRFLVIQHERNHGGHAGGVAVKD
ncbi:hypothetical protein Agub_g1679 [Astrephomene gubernaculifera]|uniref:Uncharacterized protein n=1 Tax=Astrephomene gubernaculifera TaxID=47775 RepID=A0AAD3DHV0_9CHLO|nr:hypothetical protein Agub_g1679 [Astrephomene gubernaculifera]